jgi:hypothetical protein
MSDAITDTAGQPLIYVNLRLDENTDSVVIVALIPCKANTFLASDSDGRASVLARRTGSGAAFQDISALPIDLTPYDGTTESFDFMVHSNSVTGLERVALPVRRTANP